MQSAVNKLARPFDWKYLKLINKPLFFLRPIINKMSQGGGGAGTPGAATALQGTNKVFIQRDYSEGTSVKFHTRLPPELEGLVERLTFEATITRLNEFFAEAEKGSCSTYCEGCIGCITAYLVYMCSETHYEKTLRKISKFIASQNERVYNPKGLQLIDPTYRGLRVIEISILDRPGRFKKMSSKERGKSSFISGFSSSSSNKAPFPTSS